MGEKPLSEREHTKFGGMVSSIDPHDVPPGQSVLQINGTAVRPGELVVRGGLKELSFDED